MRFMAEGDFLITLKYLAQYCALQFWNTRLLTHYPNIASLERPYNRIGGSNTLKDDLVLFWDATMIRTSDVRMSL
jgi:hypothetical protein